MAKLYRMPKSESPSKGFVALSKVCGRESSRYAIDAIFKDGDLAVATDGKAIVARKVGPEFFYNTECEDVSAEFPPWREVLAPSKGAMAIAVDPKLLSAAMAAIHENCVLLVITGAAKPIGLCAINGEAIGAVMPRCAGTLDEIVANYDAAVKSLAGVDVNRKVKKKKSKTHAAP